MKEELEGIVASGVKTAINECTEGGETSGKDHESLEVKDEDLPEIWDVETIERKMKELRDNPNATKRMRVDVLSQWVSEKSELECEEDFFSMTVFSYLKSNAAVWNEGHGGHPGHLGWGVKPEKQAQMLYSTLIITFVVCSMLGCMVY